MSEIDERTAGLSFRARNHYIDTLPYHNWSHAEDVMRIVADIADRSIDSTVRDDKNLLIIAAAWHDADYHLEELETFATKEERSADLAIGMLPELSAAERSRIAEGIIDTTVELHPKSSSFGEVLHAADVGYFADDTERFMERLDLMRQEWGSPGWAETVERTVAFGQTVIDETRPLMEAILRTEDAGAWVSSIERNLAHLQSELDSGHLAA